MNSLWIAILTVLALGCLCQGQRPPKLIKNPVGKIYRDGEPLTLECVVDLPPDEVEYTWIHNGASLDLNQANSWRFAAEKGTITLEVPFRLINDGYYQCKAKTDYGTAISDVVLLQQAVLQSYPPASPSSLTASLGQRFKMPCTPTVSIPQPIYNWQTVPRIDSKLSRAISEDNRLRIDAQGNLHFAYVQKEDAQLESDGTKRFYKCDLRNPTLDRTQGGSYTQLTVNGDEPIPRSKPQEVFDESPDVIAVRGDPMTLRCFFAGYPSANIGWSNYAGAVQRFSEGNTRMTIDKMEDHFAGTYTCTGRNDVDNTNKDFRVEVEARPTFLKPEDSPIDLVKTVKDSAEFKCQADAIPPASVQWMINGEPIDKANLDARMLVTADNRLMIDNVCKKCSDRQTDLMLIQCNASNVHGYIFGQGFLNVLDRTEVLTLDKDINVTKEMVTDRADITLECEVTNDPSPQYPVKVSWQRNQFTIKPDNIKYTMMVDRSLVIHLAAIDEDNIDLEDLLGVYYCVADNTISRETYKANITKAKDVVVVPKPAPVKGASFPWWIIAVIIVLILLIIIIIFCIYYFCCHRGEYKAGYLEEKDHKPDLEKELDDIKFHDYDRPEESPFKGSQMSLYSTPKIVDSDDERSLDMYGEPDVGKFNEDGSFLNEYDNPQTRAPTSQTIV